MQHPRQARHGRAHPFGCDHCGTPHGTPAHHRRPRTQHHPVLFQLSENGSCELQDRCRELGVETTLFDVKPAGDRSSTRTPSLPLIPALCIRCQRCVGACNNAAGNHTLITGRRGVRTSILEPFGEDWKSTNCESCGNCAGARPTGAITMKRRREYRSWKSSAYGRPVRTALPDANITSW